jgi:antitoxin ParD1/3/4
MATMNISIPDEMKAFVEEQAAKRGFGTVSEYMRVLIRAVQERQAERERVDSLLMAGLDSGPATPLTREGWDDTGRLGHHPTGSSPAAFRARGTNRWLERTRGSVGIH